jgi:ABC-2 type transport system ATP-binding protein
MSEPAPIVEHLTKRFGDRLAVDDVSFSVAAGEVFGFLGPNGAGKTTTVRVLATLLAPTSGSAVVAGLPLQPANDLEIRQRIAVMTESPGLYLRLTVAENLEFFAGLYGLRDAQEERIRRALAAVNLGGRAHDLCGSLSKGLRQRVGLARALLNDPAVVFLDEPTLGLDPAGRRVVLDHVRAVAAGRGAAVLLSTHLLDDVEACCTRVLILHRGRTVAAGTVSEVVARAAAPRSAVVRVAPADGRRAVGILAAAPGVGAAGEAPDRPGEVRVDLAADPAPALRALLDAGIAPRGLTVEGARLSDAFLEMTGAA